MALNKSTSEIIASLVDYIAEEGSEAYIQAVGDTEDDKEEIALAVRETAGINARSLLADPAISDSVEGLLEGILGMLQMANED